MKHESLVYKSPVRFSFKDKLTLFVLPPVISAIHRLICSTCKVEVRGQAQLTELQARHGKVILAFWHEVLPLAIWTHRRTGYHTLTSYSYDGELAARVIRWFGLAAVRGSSSRGGSPAVQQLELALQLGITIGFTLDGPRGPRRVAKPGIAIVAGRTRVPIVPLLLAPTRAWRMNSWDRLAIPKPFSRIVSAYGDPIEPPADDSAEEVERVRSLVEHALNEQQEKLESELGIDVMFRKSPEASGNAS